MIPFLTHWIDHHANHSHATVGIDSILRSRVRHVTYTLNLNFIDILGGGGGGGEGGGTPS